MAVDPLQELDQIFKKAEPQEPFSFDNLISPVSGTVGGGFGDSRSGGARKHMATDYMAPAGTPIVAPADLEFIQGGIGGTNLRPNDRWAHFRIPGTPYEWRIAHQGELPENGAKFQAGQPIGTVGSAINSPHLHAGFYNTELGEYEDIAGGMGLSRGTKLSAGNPLTQYSIEQKASKIAGSAPDALAELNTIMGMGVPTKETGTSSALQELGAIFGEEQRPQGKSKTIAPIAPGILNPIKEGLGEVGAAAKEWMFGQPRSVMIPEERYQQSMMENQGVDVHPGWTKPLEMMGSQAKAGIMGGLKSLVDWTRQYSDNPYSKKFGKDLSEWLTTPPEKVGEDLASKIIQGIGSAPVGIMEYGTAMALGGPVAGIAALEALKAPEGSTWKEKMGRAAGGALLGGAFKATGGLPLTQRVPAMGAIGGGQTAIEGGDARDITASATVMAILGATPGGRKLKEAVEKDTKPPDMPPKEWETVKEVIGQVPPERTITPGPEVPEPSVTAVIPESKATAPVVPEKPIGVSPEPQKAPVEGTIRENLTVAPDVAKSATTELAPDLKPAEKGAGVFQTTDVRGNPVEQEFIREPKGVELKNPSAINNISKIPDREGWEKVYKPYGEQGKGYYYSRAVDKPQPPAPEVEGARQGLAEARPRKKGEEGFLDIGPIIKPSLSAIETGSQVKQGLQALLAPGAKSKAHLDAANVLRSKIGTKNRNIEVAERTLQSDKRIFDKLGVHNPNLPLEENIGVRVMSDLSVGRPVPPEFQQYAAKRDRLYQGVLKGLADADVPLQTVRENYFPGMWKQPSVRAFSQAFQEAIDAGKGKTAAEGGQGEVLDPNVWSAADKSWVRNRTKQLLQIGEGSDQSALSYLTRRPLEGKESFRKAKTFDDIFTGVEFGLEPISNNPIDLDLLKLREMNQSLLANRAFKEWHDKGDEQFLHVSKKVPEGWKKIDDKYGTVYGPYDPEIGARPIYGYRIFKEPVAEILNNYLSKTLYNNPYVGVPYKGIMAVGNLLNQFQLGVGSFFHAGFTSLDTQITAGAEALKDIYGVARGNRSLGQLGETIKRYPQSVVKTPVEGGKVISEWRGPQVEVPENIPVHRFLDVPDMKIPAITKAAELAGAGFEMEKGLRTQQSEAMIRDWYGGKKLKAALRSPVVLTEYSMKPLMEWFVPRQKAGVFAELAGRLMEQNPNKTLEELRPEFNQAWNRVDSRLGQVRYDRVFIKNAAKNVAQAIIRAPGWTGGTMIEVGGSVKDTGTFFKEWTKTGKAPADIPDRVAYTLSLLGTMAVANGLMTMAFTGDKPSQLQAMDFWAFRTGGVDDKGRPNRFLLPSYAKDLFAYYESLSHTLLAKTHPLWNMIGNIYRNKTYYGEPIRDTETGYGQQGKDMGKYILSEYVPFWIRGSQRIAEQEGGVIHTFKEHPGKLLAPQIGVMPAPAAYTMSAAEKVMSQYHQANPQRSPSKEEFELNKIKKDIVNLMRQGKTQEAFEKLEVQVEKKKLDPEKVDRWLGKAVMPYSAADFKGLPNAWKLKVFEKANPQEREMFLPLLTQSLDRMDKFEFEKYKDKIDQLFP